MCKFSYFCTNMQIYPSVFLNYFQSPPENKRRSTNNQTTHYRTAKNRPAIFPKDTSNRPAGPNKEAWQRGVATQKLFLRRTCPTDFFSYLCKLKHE